MKDIIDSKTDKELIESLIAEQAKATKELRCAKDDLDKVRSRLSFTLMLLNRLIDKED